MIGRRDFFVSGSVLAGAAALLGKDALARAQDRPAAGDAPTASAPGGAPGPAAPTRALPPGRPGRDYTPVTVPNGATLPFRVVGGVKVFHLVAEPVRHEMAPGLVLDCWGYNGRTPGPVIEAVEGDRVRIYVSNRLPEATSVHWHGLFLPNGMDGVAGLTQAPIRSGETHRYELTLTRPGTFMYHPHYDEMTQIALGMQGMFVVHPRARRAPRVDHDFALMLGEWFVRPGTSRPDPNRMSDFNMLTFNAKAFPGTEPLVVRKNARVRMRIGNLGPMDHHPVHLHGHAFRVTATDGGAIPPSAQWPETTVLVPVGSTRDVELVADALGDWPMHCHMTHHMMNQMGHDVPSFIGTRPGALDRLARRSVRGYMTMGRNGMGGMGEMQMPVPRNSIPMRGGPGPFGYIDMGGMFTIFKVRDGDVSGDGGWYAHPAGTVAGVASPAELRADGVEVPPPPPSEPAATPEEPAAPDGATPHHGH